MQRNGLRATLLPLTALAVTLPFLGGCANTTTTKIYRDSKGTLVVEYPKDLVADGIDIDAGPQPHVKIAHWESRNNAAVTTQQGQREAADVTASTALVEAAVRAAVKSQTSQTPGN